MSITQSAHKWNVPTKPVSKKTLAAINKTPMKFSAVPGFPWYADFGITEEPENKDGKFPFYYVVGADGSLLYSGNSASGAASAAKRDALKNSSGESDKLLGSFKPSVHADLVSKPKFGEPVAPIVKKLKTIAAGKQGTDAQVKAANILKMLDQSRNYWYKVVSASEDPAMKVIVAGQAMKTFPAGKKPFEEQVRKTLSDPVVARAVKMFQLMANTGKLVKISELDMGYVDMNGDTVPTTRITDSQLRAMADYYDFIVSKYFEIIPPAQQYSITQWCPFDAPGELGTGWRGGEPVGLWDRSYNRKYAYAGFANGLMGN